MTANLPSQETETRADHELKVWPEYYTALERGEKTFEFRRDDRPFRVGDLLFLREYDGGRYGATHGYTGRECIRRVTYIARGGVIPEGFCVMSVEPLPVLDRLLGDEDVSVREMQTINAQRSARWMAGSPGWTTLEIAGELAGEVGELANVCKKLRRSEMGVPGNKVSDDVLLQQARGEIADVMIVLMLTASKLGIDLHEAVRETFNAKSEQMGFPERL